MNLEEIIFAIEAAEKLIPALLSFVNTIHPPSTPAPTRAAAVLNATSNALQVAGVTAATVQAILPTLTHAANAATGAPMPAPTAIDNTQVIPVLTPPPNA